MEDEKEERGADESQPSATASRSLTPVHAVLVFTLTIRLPLDVEGDDNIYDCCLRYSHLDSTSF